MKQLYQSIGILAIVWSGICLAIVVSHFLKEFTLWLLGVWS